MPRLILPLPPRKLKVNRGLGQHWANTLALKRDYQEQCQLAALTQEREWRGVAVQWPVHLTATAYLSRGRADVSDVGSWAKSAIDALVTLGVFPNDSPKWIRPFTSDVLRDAKRPRLELTW